MGRVNRPKDITTKLLDTLQLYNVRVEGSALEKRVREIIKIIEDVDRVELVLRALVVEAGKDFRLANSLRWGNFERVSRRLQKSPDTPIPDGAWDWALWRYNLRTTGELSPKARDYVMSIDYHLAQWTDSDDPFDPDPERLNEARTRLRRLKAKYDREHS